MPLSSTTTNDGELATNVERGDSLAESALYQKYSERVLFLALSELHSRADAEDVRAETFIRVIQALRQGKVRKPESLSSFIVGIALNVVREHRRRSNATESLTDRESEFPGAGSPESVFLDKEVARSIQQITTQLGPREQNFLRLYYYEELSNEEIAQQLGIKTERLRLIKSRTLKKFREIYQKLAKS
jgi:RNA polymerase sigma-70 factor, ECF subfamily